MWGDQREGWATEIIQFVAFLVLAVVMVFGLTAVGN